MQKNVLIAAEEIDLRARIARVLQSAGYSVELADNEKRALNLALHHKFTVAFVAPSQTLGVSMLEELRLTIPKILVLTEKRDEFTRLSPSLFGVDAFLLKSSSNEELVDRLAKIMAFGDTAQNGASSLPATLCIEERRLDLAAHVFIDADGHELPLTRAEGVLLKELARGLGEVRSRDQLRHAVAGRGADPFDRSIDNLVARLRHKIEPDPKAPRFIITVPGVGYKLVARPPSTEKEISGAKPGESERRQLTVLSCNLVDSAALAVHCDPEDVSSVVRNFQVSATAAITRMGGIVVTLTGAAILAYFGYPECTEHDAERAVQAGLDLIEKIGQLLSPTHKPLQVQVGVATGSAVVSREQVLGEPLAVAAGLCKAAAANSMLVAASTRKLLGGIFVFENTELHKVAEVSDAVSACRIVGERRVESRFKARQSNEIKQLIGRNRELRKLSALWDQAKRGEGQVALIGGEPGIGKSHLCEAFMDLIAAEPHATIRYQCSPYRGNSPFYPVINQLEQAIGFEQSDTPEIKLEKLRAALCHAVKPTQNDVLLYADLLSIRPAEREPATGLTPKQYRDRMIAALTRHLLDIARQQPLVIVLADAHWIDSSTLEFVDQIVRSIKAARVLVLIKFRQEFCPRWLGRPHVTMLSLDRLGRDESRTVISHVTRGKELPEEIQEQILSKTDGVPLFVEELTMSVLESGLVGDAGCRYVAAVDPIPVFAIPVTLLGSLTARLDRLGRAREIAQIGAAIGHEVPHQLLADVVPTAVNSLNAGLKQLAAAELISVHGEPPGATYIFKHALVRDAAYAMLSRSKRQQVHRRISDALEKNFPNSLETRPELMAHHLEQAGLILRAVDYLRKAGQRAIQHSAQTEAIGHLNNALALLRSLPADTAHAHMGLELEVMLGQALTASRGYAAPETKATLLRAKMLIDDRTDPAKRFSVLYGIWAGHYVGGEANKQRRAANEFLAEAERHNDTAARCMAHRVSGTTCLVRGEFEAGLRHLKQARALYDREHHSHFRFQYGQDIGAATFCYLSWALWHVGHVEQAAKVADEAIRRAEVLSHPHTLVYTLCHARAFIDIFNRQWEEMQSYAHGIVSLCAEHGLSHWMNCGRVFEGWAAVCGGDVQSGLETLQGGVAGWRKAGAKLWLPIFSMMEAEACFKAGRNDDALRAIDRAIAVSAETGERWALAEVLRVKAGLLQSTGFAAVRDVETLLVRSLNTARRQGARCWALRASDDLARLWKGQGRMKEAQLSQAIDDRFPNDTIDLRDSTLALP
jgi:DNA-binding response OmpR family regulator/class 3 adenylate cyclase/predicted ATPase